MTDEHPYQIFACDDQGTRNKEPEVLPRIPFSMNVLGIKGTGKTSFVINLLTREVFFRNCFDRIVIFSPTFWADDKMIKMTQEPILRVEKKNGLPVDPDDMKIRQEDIHTEPDTFIKELLKIRAEYTKLFKEKGKKALPVTCIVLDDCLSLPILRSKPLVNYLANSRHLQTSVIINTQAFKGVPPVIRQCASMHVLFPLWDREERKIIAKEVGSKFTVEEFNDIMDELFEDETTRRFIAINNCNSAKYRVSDSFREWLIKN